MLWSGILWWRPLWSWESHSCCFVCCFKPDLFFYFESYLYVILCFIMLVFCGWKVWGSMWVFLNISYVWWFCFWFLRWWNTYHKWSTLCCRVIKNTLWIKFDLMSISLEYTLSTWGEQTCFPMSLHCQREDCSATRHSPDCSCVSWWDTPGGSRHS